MLECVARDGYEATTVTHVVTAARTSRNAFYEFFNDKIDCFLAACDHTTEELLGELVGLATEPDWITAVREGTVRYLRWWQDRPWMARAYLIEVPSAGERAVERRERDYAPFRAMFADLGRRARAQQPELSPLSPLVPRVLVITITELVAEETRAGRIDRLTDLAEEIEHLQIRLLADDATAARSARHPRTPR